MVAIIPPVSQASNFIIPGNFCKGEQFENYVRNHLFPKEQYKLIHHSAAYFAQNSATLSEHTLQPGFTLQDLSTKKKFYLECKFRSALITNSFHFSKGYQTEHYKSYTDLPFFLAFGLGGNPGTPGQVFLMPLQDSQFVMLHKRHIQGKEIQKDKTVLPEELWKLY